MIFFSSPLSSKRHAPESRKTRPLDDPLLPVHVYVSVAPDLRLVLVPPLALTSLSLSAAPPPPPPALVLSVSLSLSLSLSTSLSLIHTQTHKQQLTKSRPCALCKGYIEYIVAARHI